MSDPESVDREARDRGLFDRIAHAYASKDLNPACRVARRRRLIASLDLASLPRDSDLLEVGCGAGFAAEYLQGQFRSYMGIDYAENLIKMARDRGHGSEVSFETADAKDFFNGRTYDAIFMIGVLHHVVNKDAMISNLRRSLRPGGWFIVNEPQPHNFLIRWARGLRARLDASYSSEQEQLSREALREILSKHGFENIRLQPQGFLSTPFAEVELPFPRVMAPLARMAVRSDALIERGASDRTGMLAWNCIAAGQRPS